MVVETRAQKTIELFVFSKSNTQNMETKTIARIAAVTGLLLLVPLVAMQFTDSVNWNAFDFAR